MDFKKALLFVLFLAAALSAYGQSAVKAVLVDDSTGDPVGFATVSLVREGQDKPVKYILSSEEGSVLLESVHNGSYTFKAEIMGYKPFHKQIKAEGKLIDLGEIRMTLDSEQIEAAQVSAAGNPVIVKKDTVEYNASSFKTTDSDMLEDLLKKMPGIEVDDEGGITFNGEAITKIMIDGKTFFLDDPAVASKNLPAKIINKLKVIKKKSDQARFTGIDDDEEENVIDLSVKPGLLKSLMGNFQGGAGRDVPSKTNVNDDFRYVGNGFVGRFTEGSHVSVILNANNTNNRGSGDRSGGMMGEMMGGGGGGVNTSYMVGTNAAGNLFDDRMELGGHYMHDHSNRDSQEQTYRRNYLEDHNLITESESIGNRISGGHSLGMRMEHDFSDNTSIVFEPQVHFGTGTYFRKSDTVTDYDPMDAPQYKLNEASVNNSGSNRNMSTSGRFVFRQKLGKERRTLTAMARYNYSDNVMDGTNYNRTLTFDETGVETGDVTVDQFYNTARRSASVYSRVTYTEPVAANLILETNYAFDWSRSSSDKNTFNASDGQQDFSYSNSVVNLNTRHEMGTNLMYQKEGFRMQLGLSAQPKHTYNSTTRYDAAAGTFSPAEYTDDRWNWTPRFMVYRDMSENANVRFRYNGRTNQPSISQLMPVPDNTNPLRISFGNPSLTPYFNHNAEFRYRFSNKDKFTSMNLNINGSMVQNPIVNAIWYSGSGTQFSMPFNGRNSGRVSVNLFFNTPIARSDFSINNSIGGNWSTGSSYVGTYVDMEGYPDPLEDYYAFMERFIADRPDLDVAPDFERNITNSISFNDRFRLVYRTDAFELSVGARTRMNHSRYSLKPEENLTTWSNQATSSIVWTWEGTGLNLKGDYRYKWYEGFKTDQPDEHILNAEISKFLLDDRLSLALRGWDILGQSRNMSVSDTDNYYSESVNNTLGRFVIVALSYRFGSYDG